MVLLKLGQLLTWVQLFGEEGGGGGGGGASSTKHKNKLWKFHRYWLVL